MSWFCFLSVVQSWILTVLTNGLLDQGQIFIHFWAQLGKEHTVVLDGNASDSYFTFTQRCLWQTQQGSCVTPGSDFGRSSETFLLFSITKDKFKTGKKKKQNNNLVPFCTSCVVTHPFGLRRFLKQGTVGAWSLEPWAWGQSLIFPGAYLPSYSSASADWYTHPALSATR